MCNIGAISSTRCTAQYITLVRISHVPAPSSVYAGAIDSNIGNTVIRGNTLFTANSARKRGGAIIFASTMKSVITNATCTSNTAPLGGAITSWAPNPVDRVYDNCIFIGNTAVDGGAIYLYGASGQDIITGSVFRDNYASKYPRDNEDTDSTSQSI